MEVRVTKLDAARLDLNDLMLKDLHLFLGSKDQWNYPAFSDGTP